MFFLLNCKVTFLARFWRVNGWSRRVNWLDYFQSFNCEVTKFFIFHGVSQFSKPFIFGDKSFKIHHERDYDTALTVKNEERGKEMRNCTSWLENKRNRFQASVLQTLV